MKFKEERTSRNRLNFTVIFAFLGVLFIIWLVAVALEAREERRWYPECVEYETVEKWKWKVDDCIENRDKYTKYQKVFEERNLIVLTKSTSDNFLIRGVCAPMKDKESFVRFVEEYGCASEPTLWEYGFHYGPYWTTGGRMNNDFICANICEDMRDSEEFCKENFKGKVYYNETVCIKEMLVRDT